MHPKRSPTRLEEILAEWDLDRDTDYESAVSHTIDLSRLNSNISVTSPITVTTATGTSAPWYTFNPTTTSAKIQLDGESADIQVNGWSLVAAVKRIEQRLDLLQPNPELEREWEDLRALGEQYRKLEQHIRDKQATWARLTARVDSKT